MNFLVGWTGQPGSVENPHVLLTELRRSDSALADSSSYRERIWSGGAMTGSGAQLAFADDDDWTVMLLGRACRMASEDRLIDDDLLATRWLPELRRAGHEALNLLRGGFCLAAVQRESGDFLFAVDRMGTCPLAYAEGPDGFVFSTSSESVHRHPSIQTRLRSQALFDYLYFHMIPSPETIYQEVRKLEPAEYLWQRGNGLERGFYWNPEFEDHGNASYSSGLGQELRERLHIAVSHCTPDNRTGAFLSGGLDSSTVVGMAARISQEPLQTYSIGFNADGYDEISFARIAAKHFNVRPREYYLEPGDILDAVPRIASSYDEPFGNSSAVPAYFCARMAREDGLSVLLAGDGGDELFAGNERYAKQQLFEAYFRLPGPLRRLLIEPITAFIPYKPRLPLLTKARSYIQDANIPLPRRMERYNFLHRVPADQIFERGFLETIDTDAPLTLLDRIYARARSGDALNRMLYLDWKQTLADNDLRKVNVMCELAGIHVLYPMLDDDLVDLSTRIPPRQKLKGNKLRYFYKQALSGFLPPEILTKRKHGFGLPFGVWLRDVNELKELAYDSLSSMKRRGIVKTAFLDWLMDQHQNVHAAYFGETVWVFMALELWLSSHGYAPERLL